MRIVVAHPGRQHSFRLATALNQAGLLYKYITTVYNNPKSFLMRSVMKMISRDHLSRAEKRRCDDIPDDKVYQICEFEGLLLLALGKIDKTHVLRNYYSEYVSRRFQRKLARYIISEKVDMVISYDTNSALLFSILRKRAPHVIKIMDNAHPNRHFLFHSYHINWGCCGEFEKSLISCGYLTNEKKALSFGEEVKLADYHIVASSYSTEALLYDSVPISRIIKVPYGVGADRFIKPNRHFDGNTINVLFMGEVNQRKGIKQVLDAAAIINSSSIIFNVVGSGSNHCKELFKPYEGYVNILGFVSFPVLMKLLSESHILVFPTMGEGFGLVILEAMAAGLPVIATKNCAGEDIVRDGKNGFIVDVGNAKQIADIIVWCKTHPNELESMSDCARRTASFYTWERYSNGIVSAIKGIGHFE